MEARTDKGYRGIPMEGLVATWYDRMNRKDDYRHQQTALEMSQKIPPGSRVLEVAPGPGLFAIALARTGKYSLTGLDISQSFVEIAHRHAAEAGVRVDFQQGNASAMPFKDESFDFLICQAAFKNFSQPVQAIAEMHRVLSPGGTALIIDLRRDAPREAIEHEVHSMRVGALNRAVIRWTFRNMLLKRAYIGQEIQTFAAQTPFGAARIEEDGISLRAWLHKD